MSETYARGGREPVTAGGVIITISSLVAAFLVIAGLIYATGAGQRNKAALAAASCEPSLSPSGLQCTTAQMLASQYTAIVNPASQQLSTDAAAYIASEGRDLAAAEAALTAEVASERAFDTSLARMKFPPAITPIVKALVRANQARATLTAEQARSSSLTLMRSFNNRAQLTTDAVETQLNLIHKALDPPPPAG
jgi:hypothetical protein